MELPKGSKTKIINSQDKCSSCAKFSASAFDTMKNDLSLRSLSIADTDVSDDVVLGLNQGDIRIKPGTKPPGVTPEVFFEAKIQVYGKKFDRYGNSVDAWRGSKKTTFYPQSWSKERIQAEIAYGFKNKRFQRTQNTGVDIFHGTMSDGTTIEFAIKNNVIKSAYPNLNP